MRREIAASIRALYSYLTVAAREKSRQWGFMSPKQKKSTTRARKTKAAVWIAPDLERRIKGEGGRRGLGEAPYGYYLQLADLVLKPETPPSVPPKPPKLALAKPQIAKPPRLAAAKPPKGPRPPRFAPPKPPKRSR